MSPKQWSPLREAQERALAAGHPTFNVAIPCPQRHTSARYSSNGNCVQCSKQFRGDRKPIHERQLKLKNCNNRSTRVSEDEDTVTLVAFANRRLRDLLGRSVSTSVVHKAGVVLLADYLRGNPTAQSFRSLIR